MHATSHRRVLLLGCGRSHQSDDAVGLRVAELLAESPLPCAEVVRSEAPLGDLLDALEGVELLVVVDATPATAELPPGRWVGIDQRRWPEALRARRTVDTHRLSMETALSLAGALEMLPPHVWLYAVAAERIGPGATLTPPVESAVGEVAEGVRADVLRWLRRTPETAGRAENRIVHELSIAAALVEQASRAAAEGSGRIARLRCRIGLLRQVDAGLLVEAFAVARQGTRCGSAQLEIIPESPQSHCATCGLDFVWADWDWNCPICGGEAAGLSGGDELSLDSIEVEQSEPSAVRPAGVEGATPCPC